MVINQGRLIVEVPVSLLPVVSPNYGAGVVDVTVENIDQDGKTLGTPAVLPQAYTYTRKDLAEESSISRLSRAVILELKKQIISNIVMTTHTDYDGSFGDGLHITELAETPALIITGPKLTENRVHAYRRLAPVTYKESVQRLPGDSDTLLTEDGDELTTEDGDELTQITREFIRNDVPYTADAAYQLIGVSHSQQEIQNLMTLVVQFFHLNKYITVDGSEFEIMFSLNGEPDARSSASNSNLRSFSCSFYVQAFSIGVDRPMEISKELENVPQLEAGLTYPNTQPSAVEVPVGSIYQLDLED